MTLIFQAVLSLFIGWGVFLLWRRVGATSRAVYWLVTLGVLVRAIGGQCAFWVSYLHLPFARSLQIGSGLWIFAVDATEYFERARAAASSGPGAILLLDRTITSVFFVQTLAIFVLMLGAVTSVALLLNIAAYLGCCRALLSFDDPHEHRAVVFAIAALSFSPSAIVWSLQPLKDTLFLFLVASFFGAARVWQKLWSGETNPRRLPTAALTTLIMVAVLYGISGIRWYFGIVMVLASLPFVLLTMIRSQQRWAVAVNAIVLIPLLGAAFFAGAGPFVPRPVREAVLGRDVRKRVALPNTLLNYVDKARDGFDRAGGATMIAAGGATRQVDATLGVKERNVFSEGAAPEKQQGSSGTVAVPSSPLARLMAGTAAVVLPRALGQRLGILDIRGGRGLWLFVEADTIAFDIVLIFTLISLVRGDLRAPVFWMILMVTLAVGGALAYAVSNFGTLFRHRNMVMLGLALLSLAAAKQSRSEELVQV